MNSNSFYSTLGLICFTDKCTTVVAGSISIDILAYRAEILLVSVFSFNADDSGIV